MRTARLFWRTLQQRGCQPARPARRPQTTSRTWRQASVYTAAAAAHVDWREGHVDWREGFAALRRVIEI
jgi:hypothetical protein